MTDSPASSIDDLVVAYREPGHTYRRLHDVLGVSFARAFRRQLHLLELGVEEGKLALRLVADDKKHPGNLRPHPIRTAELFEKYIYQPVSRMVPSWIVAKTEWDGEKWDWVRRQGLSTKEIDELEDEIQPDVEDTTRPEPTLSTLLKILDEKNPNSWETLVASVPVLWPSIGRGLVLMPTLSPFLFLTDKGGDKEEGDNKRIAESFLEQFPRQEATDLYERMAQHLATTLRKLIQSMDEDSTQEPTPPVVLPGEAGAAEPPALEDIRAEGFEAGGSIDFRDEERVAAPYAGTLLERLDALTERITQMDIEELTGKAAFRVSFLVRDSRALGYQWFLTSPQLREVERQLDDPSSALDEAKLHHFLERIFYVELPFQDAASAETRFHQEGMVGYMVARGQGPVVFSTPMTPMDFERKKGDLDQIASSERMEPLRENLETALIRATDCQRCESLLWNADYWTAEFVAGEHAGDSIVAVLQYADWRELQEHLEIDMSTALEHCGEVVSEMESHRAQAAASRLSMVASLTHSYKNLVMPLVGALSDSSNPDKASSVASDVRRVMDKDPRPEWPPLTWDFVNRLDGLLSYELLLARTIAQRLYSKIGTLHFLVLDDSEVAETLNKTKWQGSRGLVREVLEAFSIAWAAYWQSERRKLDPRQEESSQDQPFSVELRIGPAPPVHFSVSLEYHLQEGRDQHAPNTIPIDSVGDIRAAVEQVGELSIHTVPVYLAFLLEELAENAVEHSLDWSAKVHISVDSESGLGQIEMRNRARPPGEGTQAKLRRGQGLRGVKELAARLFGRKADIGYDPGNREWYTRAPFPCLDDAREK